MLDKKLIDELNDDITNAAGRIEDNLIDIKAALKALSRATYEFDNPILKQNPYIIKSVVKYIANGFEELDAIAMTAADYGATIERVDYLYNQQKHYTGAIKLYARTYFVKIMRKNGYTVKTIAKILRISETHVYRLEKSNYLF